MYFFDTESIGYYGATLLIQYCKDRGDPVVHDIWAKPVQETLNLIEDFANDGLVGFNLAHDIFHLARTYGCLSCLPRLSKPDPLDYLDVEDTDEAHDSFFIKPKQSMDLMLWGRKGEFQSTLNQKDITIKKIPKCLADQLVIELHENVNIPNIYFAKSTHGYRWQLIEIDENGREIGNREVTPDPDFVNIRLKFAPSSSLKAIMSKVLGKEVTTMDDFDTLTKPKECSYYPCNGAWYEVFREHYYHWTNDPHRLQYARNDAIFTRDLYDHFGAPDLGDVDSELAVEVGNTYWRGFPVDLGKVKELQVIAKERSVFAACNVNSPKQVKEHLLSFCDPMEATLITDTSDETLKTLLLPEWREENPKLVDAVEAIMECRRASKEVDLFDKLLEARRLYVTFKVIGTKSNRMAGGSTVSRGGSVNPQGIKKGSDIRKCFTLAWPGYSLDGGDFDGFEVSIAEARFGDPNLRRDLLTGKKFHGIFGAAMYKKSYDEIVATSKKNINDPDGYYQRAKRGVFAWFYGAFFDKIASAMWLTREEVEEGINLMEIEYPGIKKAREEVYEKFAALKQPEGIGTRVEWCAPSVAVESFLGFKRFFTLEFEVIEKLFAMAQKPSAELLSKGKSIKVMRRDRLQTGSGAVSSALYAAAFNLQSAVMRSAANHHIQSPGGQITKDLQGKIWALQPSGCHPAVVAPINIHDELVCVTQVDVRHVVERAIEEYKSKVPLIAMNWKTNKPSWGDL